MQILQSKTCNEGGDVAGRGRPATLAGMLKTNQQWTPEQSAWLRAKAQASGVGTVAAVARMVVQQAMDAERSEQAAAS